MRREAQSQPAAGDWKRRLEDGLYETGLLRAFHGLSRRYELVSDGKSGGRVRRVRRAKFVVLGYHRVGTDGVPFYSTLSQQTFAEQMRYITRHYRVLSVRQMAEELTKPDSQGQGIVVTFDDGYLGTFTQALPILQTYKVPATVYLTAGAVETGEISWYDRIFLGLQRVTPQLTLMLERSRTFHLHDHATRIEAATEIVTYLRSMPDERRKEWCRDFEKKIPLSADDLRDAMMTWDEVRLMHRSGISFGAHTMTHPVAGRMAPDALRSEIAESQRLIEERLQSRVDEFAFPFGKPRDCGMSGTPILRELGFRTALTTIVGVNEPGADLFRLRRIVVSNETSIARFALQLNRLFFHPVDEERSAVPDVANA